MFNALYWKKFSKYVISFNDRVIGFLPGNSEPWPRCLRVCHREPCGHLKIFCVNSVQIMEFWNYSWPEGNSSSVQSYWNLLFLVTMQWTLAKHYILIKHYPQKWRKPDMNYLFIHLPTNQKEVSLLFRIKSQICQRCILWWRNQRCDGWTIFF